MRARTRDLRICLKSPTSPTQRLRPGKHLFGRLALVDGPLNLRLKLDALPHRFAPAGTLVICEPFHLLAESFLAHGPMARHSGLPAVFRVESGFADAAAGADADRVEQEIGDFVLLAAILRCGARHRLRLDKAASQILLAAVDGPPQYPRSFVRDDLV